MGIVNLECEDHMLKFAFKNKALRALFLLALVTAFGMPLIFSSTLHPFYRQLIVNNAEHDAIRLASHLTTDLMQDRLPLQADTFGKSDASKLRRIQSDFHLYRIKVFKADGEIVLSTSPEDLGQKNKQDYVHDLAARGQPFTKVVRKTQPRPEAESISLDVVECYVPIMIANVGCLPGG